MYDYGYGYNTNDYDTTLGLLGGMAAFGGVMLLVSFAIGILTIVSLWKIYKKAGKAGWESIIPIYNIIVLIQIVELPTWYILLFFVPFANIYAMFKIYIELAHKFGKSTGFGVLTVLFSVVCLPILAFSKNCIYNGSNNSVPMNNHMNFDPNTGQPLNQSNINNMPNNSVNNENQVPLWNQNINTEINQIQPEINNNNMVALEQSVNPTINLMQQPTSLEQPVTNETTGIVPQVETIASINPNNMNSEPTQVNVPTNNLDTSTQIGYENQNVQPTAIETPTNVVSPMKATPEQVLPNQNDVNNPNIQ